MAHVQGGEFADQLALEVPQSSTSIICTWGDPDLGSVQMPETCLNNAEGHMTV